MRGSRNRRVPQCLPQPYLRFRASASPRRCAGSVHTRSASRPLRSEAALQTSLRNAGRRNRSGDRVRLAKVLRRPVLDTVHRGIGMRLASHQACKRQLAFAVPLEQVDLGDAQRLAGTAVARNDVQPCRSRSAGCCWSAGRSARSVPPGPPEAMPERSSVSVLTRSSRRRARPRAGPLQPKAEDHPQGRRPDRPGVGAPLAWRSTQTASHDRNYRSTQEEMPHCKIDLP